MFKFYFRKGFPIHSISVEADSLFKAMKQLMLVLCIDDLSSHVTKVVSIKNL